MLIDPFSLLNCLRFEEDGGGGAADSTETDSDDEQDRNEKVNMTKAELDHKFIAREKRAKARAQQEYEESLASKFGMTVEEAAELVKKHKEQQDKEKSEAQKAREAAEAERAALSTEREQIARDQHAMKVEKALMRLGVDAGKVDRIARMVTVDVGADDEAITEAVEEIKEEFPAVFGTTESNGYKPGNTSTTKAPAPKKPVPEGGIERGRQRALARMPHKQQT